jgi:hypothetical protein
MRAIDPVDSAQKRGKSAKICEFSGKFIHSFSRNLVLFQIFSNLKFQISNLKFYSNNKCNYLAC